MPPQTCLCHRPRFTRTFIADARSVGPAEKRQLSVCPEAPAGRPGSDVRREAADRGASPAPPDRREACRQLDERVRRHEDAVERLTEECRQLDDPRGASDRTVSSLTSDPCEKRGRGPDDLGGKSSLLLERKMADGVRRQHDVAEASISKLQRECDKLQEAIRRLHDDNKHKHVHIQQLLRTTEHLQENKADKRSLHAEVKKHLEAEHKNLQSTRERRRSSEDSQHDAEGATAAGVRKQLLDTHHCLSCDRRVVRHLHAAKSVTGAWPLSDVTHFRYPPVSRSCGGARTVTPRTDGRGRRRTAVT
ncbi:uncharacterized protein LOC133465988 isoform X7 [Phyllopteryx taeniolatus]|uniref:uncharacterized protein LOC133465988 isoform X7 n=1 Tax=Phyllopteryx taeniolatus TaxID=161469 RepID=UPI002AD2E982|nr:uncharacterized protein LOC133465988 isoform X7 [Phyllopteryx taeniolatus]